MADNTRYNFTKGMLRTSAKNPYQDPTFLTFTLKFDMLSPLFNKDVAVKSLREQYKEETKATQLEKFISTLTLINKEMPWYFKSISGIDTAFDIDMLEPYLGGDDKKLEIECNESINLAITGLMDLYREAVYNLDGWTQVLPENYKRFNMYVIVSEVRNIQTVKNNKSGKEVNINDEITADSKPMFMFKYKSCKFDITSGKETFSSLSSAEPSSPQPKIRIKYEDIIKFNATYLNGISDITLDGSPGVGTEDKASTFSERGLTALDDALNTAMGGITNFDPISKLTRPNNVYGSVFNQAFERAVGELDDIAGGISRIPNNLFKDGLNAAENEVQSLIKSAKANIFGIKPGSTLGAALKQGSINSIFPDIQQISLFKNKNNLGNINK